RYLACLVCARQWIIFFFFSSRRRHTRFSRDWSSDVCSSDLALRISTMADSSLIARKIADMHVVAGAAPALIAAVGTPAHPEDLRSEERRVGKEGRSRWARCQ